VIEDERRERASSEQRDEDERKKPTPAAAAAGVKATSAQVRRKCSSLHVIDHPQSSLVYNFGRVCLSVCQTITFESLDVGSLY